MFMALFCNNSIANMLNSEHQIKSDKEIVNSSEEVDNIYVATNNSVQQLFYVLGATFSKPIIVSTEAAKKRVSGNFDLNKPKELFTTVASRTGLVWYDDGSSVFVYDSNEIKSNVIRMVYAPFEHLVSYLQSTGLYDSRFPLRSNGKVGSFYVSGPPVYIELVSAAAKYIDATYAKSGAGVSTIRVIKLNNTFVNDRAYTLRDKPVVIPGVATVLNQLLNDHAERSANNDVARVTLDNDTQRALETASSAQAGDYPPLPAYNTVNRSQEQKNHSDSTRKDYINIVAYSDTNSLLIRGSENQVRFVEDLVNSIDTPKKQIQLSLWIIDISKSDIDELGVNWQARATMGNSGITFNTSSLAPDKSMSFIADVTALAKKGDAQIVSRPEILAQENVPALFDNNSSYYTKLIGERTASLEKVTYGTMISVLPRLDQHQREIEMNLNIQDGGIPLNIDGSTKDVDNLPMVNNTQISTQARVPVGYSLLVGGYSRVQNEQNNQGIPLLRDIPVLGKLFDYSYTSQKKMIRLFLIHPQLMLNGETWQGRDDSNPVLGHSDTGKDITLKSTVSMLRQMIIKQ